VIEQANIRACLRRKYLLFGTIETFQASRMAVLSHRFRCPREIQVPALPRGDFSPDFFCGRSCLHCLGLPPQLLLEPFGRERVAPPAQADLFAFQAVASRPFEDRARLDQNLQVVFQGPAKFLMESQAGFLTRPQAASPMRPPEGSLESWQKASRWQCCRNLSQAMVDHFP